MKRKKKCWIHWKKNAEGGGKEKKYFYVHSQSSIARKEINNKKNIQMDFRMSSDVHTHKDTHLQTERGWFITYFNIEKAISRRHLFGWIYTHRYVSERDTRHWGRIIYSWCTCCVYASWNCLYICYNTTHHPQLSVSTRSV